MIKRLFDWLEHRTGHASLLKEALYENIPGGARWRYIWGSTLTFALFVQFVTGVFLWMHYVPGSNNAWESVYYIQNEMMGGWLLRGLHHFTAQAMTVLLLLHLMQVVIDGAYKAPREVNFWFGVVLLMLTLGLSLTGYLLPWDQKGFWATKVATNILGITPIVGPAMQKLVIGGPDYGHHTLTRFFALHAGVLPGAIIALLAGHIYLFRKHGITAKQPLRKPDTAFWPDQVLKDAVACLAVLVVILFFILRYHGPDLGAPADPSEPYSAARPEWYFLFLFQFLKYFPGGTEIWGAIVIPTILMGALIAMPIFGRWKLGHRFNVGFLFALVAGAALLTYLAKNEDSKNADYVVAVKQAEEDAKRVKELAQSPLGIPPAGAVTLLRSDAFTQGPKLFAKNCANCHRYGSGDGMGGKPKGDPSASNLKDFGSREWLTEFLKPENVDNVHFLGATKFKDGKMVKFVKKSVANFSADEKEQLKKVVMAVSAEAHLKLQEGADARDVAAIEEGRKLIATESMRCTECHQFQKKDEDATAPLLTGYGSRDWIVGIINNPKHEKYYGDRNDRMPAFGADKMLDETQIGLIADWLRHDWYEPAQTAAK
ncbi:MAG: menaquinol-cytochrome reductase [Verrucomicrobiales bacterium]|nr:menaquinol-cytochrome reductase [Verrucomicrobiales bacterium]